MDQGRNAGHHQRHRGCQTIKVERKGDIYATTVEPGKEYGSGALTLGIAPKEHCQHKGSGHTNNRHNLGEEARQTHAEEHVDHCATERQEKYEEEQALVHPRIPLNSSATSVRLRRHK